MDGMTSSSQTRTYRGFYGQCWDRRVDGKLERVPDRILKTTIRVVCRIPYHAMHKTRLHWMQVVGRHHFNHNEILMYSQLSYK